MRSLLENRRLVLILAVLALASLTVLAISLNRLPFREAQHFMEPETQSVPLPAPPSPPIQVSVPLWKQLLVLGLFGLLVILVMLLMTPEGRKRLLRTLSRLAMWIVGIYILLKLNPNLLRIFADLFGLSKKPLGHHTALDDPLATPMPIFEPPQVSSTTSYVISFVFALILLALFWSLYRGWARYQALNTPRKSLDEIARIARSSLDDLSSGRNSSDVIINCYLRMSDVVSIRRRLQREIAMTPREFAVRLEQAGLPGEAVAQLTRLFEGVRYGDRKSGPRDVNEAVRCLETILHYCGEPT
jgi:hypothetical protein